jgi:hypothetical protein
MKESLLAFNINSKRIAIVILVSLCYSNCSLAQRSGKVKPTDLEHRMIKEEEEDYRFSSHTSYFYQYFYNDKPYNGWYDGKYRSGKIVNGFEDSVWVIKKEKVSDTIYYVNYQYFPEKGYARKTKQIELKYPEMDTISIWYYVNHERTLRVFYDVNNTVWKITFNYQDYGPPVILYSYYPNGELELFIDRFSYPKIKVVYDPNIIIINHKDDQISRSSSYVENVCALLRSGFVLEYKNDTIQKVCRCLRMEVEKEYLNIDSLNGGNKFGSFMDYAYIQNERTKVKVNIPNLVQYKKLEKINVDSLMKVATELMVK